MDSGATTIQLGGPGLWLTMLRSQSASSQRKLGSATTAKVTWSSSSESLSRLDARRESMGATCISKYSFHRMIQNFGIEHNHHESNIIVPPPLIPQALRDRSAYPTVRTMTTNNTPSQPKSSET